MWASCVVAMSPLWDFELALTVGKSFLGDESGRHSESRIRISREWRWLALFVNNVEGSSSGLDARCESWGGKPNSDKPIGGEGQRYMLSHTRQ